MKILKPIIVIVCSILFVSFLWLLQPWAFIPHKHIEISLPFAASDDATTSLIPMGEKIEHNESNGNPDGHPGIDFGFKKVTGILSVSDGIVLGTKSYKSGGFDVTVLSGFYKITYKELNSLEPDIRFLKVVKQGDLLGYSGTDVISTEKPKEGDPSRQIHWEFSSGSMILDRLCPLNYFDNESKVRIENIWENVPSTDIFKIQYPEICNGFFKDRED